MSNVILEIMYTYFQLFDSEYNEFVKGSENPASIPDCTHGQTAAKMARKWMRENNIQSAILITNVLTDNGCDNILSQRVLCISVNPPE